MSTPYDRNRNARIVSRSQGASARTTFTDRRDQGSLVASMNTSSNNSSSLVINRGGVTVELSGNEARTLFSLLEKHYYG